MKQLFLLACVILGIARSQPCRMQSGEWMSPINLQGPRYEDTFKPLHVFSFRDGGEGLVMENTGDTVRIQFPVRTEIHSVPANLSDIVISKGPLADKYTADHLEFRWGPATLPVDSSSSTGGSGAAVSSSTGLAAGGLESSSSTGGALFLDLGSMVQQAPVEYGSDHAFSGHYFPLEMQVFFYNTKYKSYAEAQAASPTEPNPADINEDVVALSVLFEVGDQNDELTHITDRLELIRNVGTETGIIAKTCFEKVLNKGRDFITYPGSLTRAPCTHGVRWIVLVESLTVSASQLNEFRQLSLNQTEWLPPLDMDLNGRLVQTNLRQLPLDDKFIPEWHPHGPPVTTINPKVGGTIINPYATSESDLNYKNYWSPFDYTIQDDVVAPAGSSTGGAASTGDGSTAEVTPTESSVGATGGGGVSGPTGGMTGGGATGTGALVDVGAGASSSGGGGGGGGGGGAESSATAEPIPADTAESTAPTVTPTSSSAVNMNTEPSVKIPNIFHLGSTAYFTPDFEPHRHNSAEENHYHPPSLNDIPDNERDLPRLRKGHQKSLNPERQGPMPQLKQKIQQKVARRHWK